MSIESDIVTTLGSLVPAAAFPRGKVFPDTFPANLPWPAIRYTFIDAVPDATVCGSGGDNETDFRVQIDAIAPTGDDRDALRLLIITAMRGYPIPNTLDSWSKEYDSETKAYRVTLDYLLQPSTTP